MFGWRSGWLQVAWRGGDPHGRGEQGHYGRLVLRPATSQSCGTATQREHMTWSCAPSSCACWINWSPLSFSCFFFYTQWQKKEISIIFLPLLGLMLDHRDIFLAQQSLHWFLLLLPWDTRGRMTTLAIEFVLKSKHWCVNSTNPSKGDLTSWTELYLICFKRMSLTITNHEQNYKK